MRAVIPFLILLAGAAIALSAFDAVAAERPAYGAGVTPQARQDVERYLSLLGVPPRHLEIAATDLNDDRTAEMIVRQTDAGGMCPQDRGCAFFILGDTEDGFILIGNLRAYSLEVDTARTSGVRNLLAYRDRRNDFAATVFVWAPGQSLYRATGQDESYRFPSTADRDTK